MAVTKGIAKAKGHGKTGGKVDPSSAKGYHSQVGNKDKKRGKK
jgi:hypothetical protein